MLLLEVVKDLVLVTAVANALCQAAKDLLSAGLLRMLLEAWGALNQGSFFVVWRIRVLGGAGLELLRGLR